MSNQDAEFVWMGDNLKTNLDYFCAMKDLLSSPDGKEIIRFKNSLRWAIGPIQCKVKILSAAMLATFENSKVFDPNIFYELMLNFLGIDINKSFFLVEMPNDRFGSTLRSWAVMEVRFIFQDGSPWLQMLQPSSCVDLIPFDSGYLVVRGPARDLTSEEWKGIVGFVHPLS